MSGALARVRQCAAAVDASAECHPPLPRRRRHRERKILYLEHLTVSFDGFKALNDLTLHVEPGELRCIIGPNGAGKTTMMDVVTGKTRPDHGTRVVRAATSTCSTLTRAADRPGRHRPQVPEADRVRGLQRVREPGAGAGRRQVVLEGAGRAAAAGGARSHRRGAAGHRPRRRSAHALAGTLSHGQKQWLEIGMLLAQRPELLLIDEPVAGMTPQEAERTAELLLSLEGTHSVVVVEHDMEFVRSIARRVTVLHEGHVHRRRATWTTCRTIRRSRRCISEHEPARRSRGAEPVVRRQPHAVGRRPRGRGGIAHLPDGPQRHGQDHPAEVHHGPAADACRATIAFEGTDLRPLPGRGAGARSASATCRRAGRSFRS